MLSDPSARPRARVDCTRGAQARAAAVPDRAAVLVLLRAAVLVLLRAAVLVLLRATVLAE